MAMTKLLDGVTGASNGAPVQVSDLIDRASNTYPRGDHITFMARGTFQGLTMKVQTAPTSSGPWLDHDDATFTAAGDQVSPISRKAWVRGVSEVDGTEDSTTDGTLYAG